jgi:hypothetical protein
MKKLVLWPVRVWAPVNLSTIVWPRKEFSENECSCVRLKAHYAAFSPTDLGGLPNRVAPGRNGTGSLGV